ncbi:MAG: D-2-hydroxyacid dehydrogenase [Spirochaetota bacterium]
MESIVALDAHGVNPGDLSWHEFERLGRLQVYAHSSREQIIPRARGASAVLTDMLPLGEREFAELPDLRYVGLFATGYDQVDVEAARRRGIAVTNVPEYSTPSVAQMTFALLLSLTNQVGDYANYVARGHWRRGETFEYLDRPLVELSGKTIGILGFGPIGAAVARIAHAFGMHIVAWSRSPKPTEGFTVEWVELLDVFRRADVVTLHLPLTEETTEIVNRRTLSLMKPSAFLVNTARGGLINDADLAAGLSAGRPAAAALDVLGAQEPPAPDNPLLSAPNCIITPHVAWATHASRSRCLREAASNLESFLHGNMRNRIV